MRSNIGTIGKIALVIICAYALLYVGMSANGQDAKPAPTGIAIENEPKSPVVLKEIDRLRYENQILRFSNIQVQLSQLQTQAQMLQEKQAQIRAELDAWRKQTAKEYGVDDSSWTFNDNLAQFEKKKVE